MMKCFSHIVVMRLLSLFVCAMAVFAVSGNNAPVMELAQSAELQIDEAFTADRGNFTMPDEEQNDDHSGKFESEKPMATVCGAEVQLLSSCSRPSQTTSLQSKLRLTINRCGILQCLDTLLFRSTLSGMSSLIPHFCAASNCYAIVLRHNPLTFVIEPSNGGGNATTNLSHFCQTITVDRSGNVCTRCSLNTMFNTSKS